MERLKLGMNGTAVAMLETTNRASAVGQSTASKPGHCRDGVDSTTNDVVMNAAMSAPNTRIGLLGSVGI